MNQLIIENELVSSSRIKTVLAASGSLVALYGTYLLIKHRDRLANRFFNKTSVNNNDNEAKIKFNPRIVKEDKLISSRVKIEQDLKGFSLDLDKKSYKDKMNTMNDFWIKRKSDCLNTNTTYLSNFKNESNNLVDYENDLQVKENEIVLTKMSMDELIANFKTFNMNQKKLTISLVSNSQNLFHLVKLLGSSFTDETNPDLFEKYTFNNLDGDLYTDWLIKLLNKIKTLSDQSDLMNLNDQDLNIIDLLFIYLKKFEKNKNLNTKRSSKIQEIKYLSIYILSNLINNIGLNLIEEILSKEYGFLTFKSDSINNSMVYLKFIENLLKSCLKFSINYLNVSHESIFSFLKSEDLIDYLKVYETEPKLTEFLDSIYNVLIELKQIWNQSSSNLEINDNDNNMQTYNEIEITHSNVSVQEKEVITLSYEQEPNNEINLEFNSLTLDTKIF